MSSTFIEFAMSFVIFKCDANNLLFPNKMSGHAFLSGHINAQLCAKYSFSFVKSGKSKKLCQLIYVCVPI